MKLNLIHYAIPAFVTLVVIESIVAAYHQRDWFERNIIWDRMFGTFQREEEHPTYGLTTPINTYNPIKIAFFEWVQITKDLMKPISWKARFMYLFAPPGWSHDGSTQTLKQAKRDLKNLN